MYTLRNDKAGTALLYIVGLLLVLALCTGCKSSEDTGISENAGNEGASQVTNGEDQAVTKEASTPTPTPEATPTPEPTPTVAPTPTMSPQEIYEEAVEKSLLFTGNNYRIKKVLEKLRAGQDIYVAALGGSVTEGAGASSNDKGYAYLFADELKKTYAPEGSDTVHFVNAGLSGTPSSLGIMRYKQDVLDLLGHVPDLLIIEFAVNDWQEATGGRAYESLICEALSANEECAVICMCSVSKGNWNTQDVYLPIAKNYLVPVVSVRNAVFKTTSGKNERISASMYFYDEYHPSSYGHTLMKNCLMNLLKTVDEAEENVPKEMPESVVKGRDFVGLTAVDSVNTVDGLNVGSFGATDDKVVTMYFTKAVSFPNNFYHKAGEENTPLTLKVKCKNILINYKTSTDASFGNAAFYVDGELVATAEGHTGGAWNNCNCILVFDEKEAAEHTLEVKMAEGSEDKAFTILSIGYIE
ncbi:MAG: SGNH/GDSL hydrolase family protein [Lachnospiraceae bacterium]|nr:SGNH/GDSL hydrolase family protein [Lachnospiraceae bacterium]